MLKRGVRRADLGEDCCWLCRDDLKGWKCGAQLHRGNLREQEFGAPWLGMLLEEVGSALETRCHC